MYNTIFFVLYRSEIWPRAKKILLFFLEESNVEDILCTICYIGKHIKEDYMRGICDTRVSGKLYYSKICGMEGKTNLLLSKGTEENSTRFIRLMSKFSS